jgi:hypothetical protein
LEAAWEEDGASVIYPPPFEQIPRDRGPYLYYRAQIEIKGRPQQVLRRRPTNPIMNRVELFAPFSIAGALSFIGGETLEVTVRSEHQSVRSASVF